MIMYRMSLGTGRPMVLRDESSIRHCRILLNHPMASATDVRLVAQVELIAQKSMLDIDFYIRIRLINTPCSANLRNLVPIERPG